PVREGRGLSHVAPLEELHRVVGAGLVDAVVVHADDPRMIEAGEDMILAPKSLDDDRAFYGLRAQPLKSARLSDRPVEHSVNDAHPAGCELLLHDIAIRRALKARIELARVRLQSRLGRHLRAAPASGRANHERSTEGPGARVPPDRPGEAPLAS